MSTPDQTEPSTPTLQTATLGGGCFWCLEAVFKRAPGVHRCTSGYAGGHLKNPTYREVCEGTTGHAEVLQVTFDPAELTYDALLDLFWEAHDPTTLNRQGPDSGTQYRSVIYTHDQAQLKAALASRDRAASRFNQPIVTEIAPLDTFYPAEDYHHDYYDRNPSAGYCVYVIRPKIDKLSGRGSISA